MSNADEPGTRMTNPGTHQAGSQRPRAANRAGNAKSAGKSRARPTGLSTAAILGFSAALITFVLDQATKLYTLFVYDLPVKEPAEVLPFINLIVVWNRGISYGLFQQNSDLGRWVLVAVSILASIGLSIWIRRTTAKLLATSLGLIVGGALGNVVDRIWHGAVFDFIQFHVGSWSWYVFNVADAAIVAGVAGLLYDSFVLEGRRAKS
jgi:signal peptidase II